jgi:predicted nuclease with TOPRIM domain
MSLFTDILKGLPENAVLRSKVADAETRYAALETENAILKDDLRDANTEIRKLKKQIEELTHTDNLNEAEITLLQSVSKHQDVNIVSVAQKFGIDRGRVEYHIQRLIDLKYVDFKGFDFDGIYLIEQKGREALMTRGLI